MHLVNVLGCFALFTDIIFAVVTVERHTRFQNGDAFVLNTFVDVPYDQCIQECSSRSGCRAVEYRYLPKYCRLMRDISNTVIAPGHVTVSGLDGTVACGGTQCESGEACDAETTTCMIKECGVPTDGPVEKGNRFVSGSKLEYTCLGISQVRVCMDSGAWGPVVQSGLTCSEIRQADPHVRSGVYLNRLNVPIYCDFVTDGGDWLVFQRRRDGSENFYRSWDAYKNGFGDPCWEFWLGLENIHTIMQSAGSEFELRIDLLNFDDVHKYAVYDNFSIGPESDGYRLHVGTYSGTAGDAITFGLTTNHPDHDGAMFTTYDQNNNLDYSGNCATEFRGAWWYAACHQSHLNGLYYQEEETPVRAKGIIWYPWTTHSSSLKGCAMKMREKSAP